MNHSRTELTETSTSDDLVVGVDMGGTKILASVITADGKIISQSKTATRADKGANKVIDRIARCIREAIG